MDVFENNKSKINLRDINSSFIIKRIFSFLDEKQKLKMIVFNKGLQKMFLKSIEDYKRKIRKYKIGAKNGKGKEYILYSIIFIFEGEYLNGKKIGKGKEYDIYGKLIFEGEYLNGNRWNGNLYSKKENMKIEINDETVNIKEYDNNKIKFVDENLNKKINGT